ncbi:Coatomer beta subunit [Trema orientale]|uniref:Coatomer beta subunit n=1 Tax=Trema orientale TaxID=63057 RepID=A0A2P5CLW0_TREOI|nr:Coatomer beta subunit [Trema orientale]
MASLSQLLAEEVFERGRKLEPRQKSLRYKDRIAPENEPNTALPLYICHGGHDQSRRRSYNNYSSSSNQNAEKSLMGNGPSVSSSKRVGSASERSNSKSSVSECSRRGEDEETLIDEAAVRAVVSILSGYVGRYMKDETFRENVREKCSSCLVRRKMDYSDDGIFENLELGIESIDKLVEERGKRKEIRMKTARNAIQLLSIVASLNTNKTKNGLTCGTPNSHLSSCAQLYLAIVYKLEKNDRTSARHLLQVFRDSPFLARTHLVPDLWEHFFLPHLLHLKVWYTKELECLRDFDYGDKEKKMKALSKVYNEQMDMGTIEFALYYTKWLKVGVKSPAVPRVPLPERPYRKTSRRSMDSCSTQSSINNNLYRTVFGSMLERQSMIEDQQNGALKSVWGLDEEGNLWADKDNYNGIGSFPHGERARRRSSSQIERNQKSEIWRETQKVDNFRFLSCQQIVPLQIECLLSGNPLAKNNSVRKKEESTYISSNLSRAIACICSSDSLSECEHAIRVITKAWLDSHSSPVIEAALSKAPVIEGMLEVLFASDDDEILELLISILAELVAKSELNRLIVLNSDPQLEIFMKHLRSNSLFLKAAVLLYLSKPKAKQMISVDWVPLVLRVIEFGDQLQTLFTVHCSPLIAAFYLLDQLLTGFDEDRNLDNARHVVSLGGLSLLVSKIQSGDTLERINATVFILCCIRADGSCRNYLTDNLNIDSLLELIVLEYHGNPSGSAFALLIELLCLNRRTQINAILDRLKEGWGGMNTMHILFFHLQKAPNERPLVASILLQLDLLGDLSKCSIYREEAVEAIIAALDCQKCHEKVQEQSARALLMLGGRFSYNGEASIENWLLEQAGFHECSTSENSYQRPENKEEEDATEKWQRKAASVLFKSGNKRLLAALSESISNGIPSLARASLITISWMCIFLHSIGDENLKTMAWSILVPQLVASLDYDKDVEGRVLASYSLLNLTKSSAECISMLLSLNKDQLLSHLKHLRLVTWTAEELLAIISS